MNILLSELIRFLISPLTWIIILLMAGIFVKDTPRRRKYLMASAFLAIIFSNTFLFDRFMNAWEIKARKISSGEHYSAAIVLTGMTTYDPRFERLEFNDRTDRIMQAVKLYKEKIIETIILSGGIIGNESDTAESYHLKDFLLNLGIEKNDIIVEAYSKNTHENAVMVKTITQNMSEPFLLITSAFHLRRATASFLNEGISVIPYATDRYAGPMKWNLEYLILPSSETLFNWEKLLHEWVGMGTYYLRGYL